MKVEVINENKIQITLSMDELSQRDISLKEIEVDSKKARKLFLDLIAENNLEQEFTLEHTQVLVEATTDCNNEFIVTITKIEDFPDLNKFDILNTTDSIKYSNYYSNFNIYEFDTLDTLINLSKILKKNSCYLGKNSIYKYNNLYYLIFNSTSTKNVKFTKTASLLNEYCTNMYENGIYETSLKEKATLILENRAIQKLIKV